MKNLILVCVMACLSGSLFAQVNRAAEATNQFAFELYKQNSNGGGNLFFSPLSIEAALAMTSAGAQKETLIQMNRTLHLGPNDHPEFKSLLGQLRGNKDFQLYMANRIWSSQGKEYVPSFLKLLLENYKADLFSLDFRNQTEPSRIIINEWVQKQTNDKIKDLLAKGLIKPNTEMVLTNAIYFKGRWLEPFLKAKTKDGKFTTSAGMKETLPLMHLKAHFRYSENTELQFLEMAYKGDELVMDVILPKSGVKLSKIEQKLSPANVKELTQISSFDEVEVSMPKFRAETTLNLSDNLKTLGMPLAFDEKKADFRGIRKILPNQTIYISDVIHKAFIELDEEGTEAAAATAVVMGVGGAMPQPPKIFTADRPFLYFIRHVKSGAILFMGRYSQP